MHPQSTPAESRSPRARSTAPLSPGERALLDGFAMRVVDAFGAERLKRIVVFGSRARGAGHMDSDLDVAVLMSAFLTRPIPCAAPPLAKIGSIS
jgi:hypothetical protein